MSKPFLAFLAVFVSMLASGPLLLYAPTHWRRFLRVEVGFIMGTTVLFSANEGVLGSLGGVFAFWVLAPITGILISLGLTKAVTGKPQGPMSISVKLGNQPNAEPPPEGFLDPPFRWQHKFTNFVLPWSVGLLAASLLYTVIAHAV